MQINRPSARLLDGPDLLAETASELLYGESVTVLDTPAPSGWAKIRCETDSYEGFVESSALGPLEHPHTHALTTLQSHLYRTPDFKTPPVHSLSFLSRLTPTGEQQSGFARLEKDLWIWAQDIAPLDAPPKSSPIDTALRFLGTPYLWGGRTAWGIDCSALVQLAVLASGRPCPRDTKDQILHLGTDLGADKTHCQRGDFVFFERHVGIMVDQHTVLNATARPMRTVLEPLEDLCAGYGGLLKIRRLV